MTQLIVRPDGAIAVPEDVRERYGMEPATSVRLVDTGYGVLLVPLTDEPPCPALADEIAEWQALGMEAWANHLPVEDKG